MEGSSEEAVEAALAAGASTTSAVARGSPSVLGAATELLLGAELAVALAWEVAVATDLGVEVLVSVVAGLALVEVLVGSALAVDREAVEGLALAR